MEPSSENIQDILKFFERPAQIEFGDENIKLGRQELVVGEKDKVSTSFKTIIRQLGYLGRKKRYYDFMRPEIRDSMAWPNEVVNKLGKIETLNPSEDDLRAYINADRDAAHAWFRDLTAEVKESPSPKSLFVLGDPGTGKSTLLKYLPNAMRDFTNEEGVIYTRFEAHKFLERRGALEANNPEINSDLEALHAYLYVITLRDVITNDALEVTQSNSLRVKKNHPLFGSNFIDDFFDKAVGDMQIDSKQETQTKNALRLALTQPDFRPSYLFEIPVANVLRMLVNYAVGSRKVVFIFDGLDLLQPHDGEFEQQKYQIFSILMYQYSSTNVQLRNLFKRTFQFYGGQIIVQRHRTYIHWMRKLQTDQKTTGDIEYEKVGVAYVIATSAHSILRKSVPVQLDVVSPSLFYVDVKRTLDEVLRVLLGTRYRPEKNEIFGFFDGNLRDEFAFVRRLLIWIASELGEFHNPNYTLKSFASKLREFETSQLLTTKKYRIIQLLLRWDSPIFENLVHVDKLEITDPNGSNIINLKFSRNDSFTGLVDNIFNYNSVPEHFGLCKHHCLLMKIRVLQILSTVSVKGGVSIEEIYSRLMELGYSKASLKNLLPSLRVLRYGTLVKESVDYSVSHIIPIGPETRYEITNRGEFAVNTLLFNTGYLENCFHQILLPTKIIATESQRPRDNSIRSWALNSVSNYFILTKYISFVESNLHSSVAPSLRISNRINETAKESVLRMCRVEFGDEAFLQDALTNLYRANELLSYSPI